MGFLVRRLLDLNAWKEVGDTVVASVVWRIEALYRIALIRRGDCGVALLDGPGELGMDLKRLNVEAVFRNAMVLHRTVGWVLPDAKFVANDVFGETALRDGAVPAELGCFGRFGTSAFGVDIGEYALPLRRCLI